MRLALHDLSLVRQSLFRYVVGLLRRIFILVILRRRLVVLLKLRAKLLGSMLMNAHAMVKRLLAPCTSGLGSPGLTNFLMLKFLYFFFFSHDHHASASASHLHFSRLLAHLLASTAPALIYYPITSTRAIKSQTPSC